MFAKLLALVAGHDVAKQLHVDDGKQHEEDPGQEDDAQQLRPVPHYLEEEVLDGVVDSY